MAYFVILLGYKVGINFFDTADTYGDLAEKILAEAEKPFRHKVYLATKVDLREGIKQNRNKECIHQACQNSLKRFTTERIDLYQIHFDDPNTPVSDTLSA